MFAYSRLLRRVAIRPCIKPSIAGHDGPRNFRHGIRTSISRYNAAIYSSKSSPTLSTQPPSSINIDPKAYKPPTTGLISKLPSALIPYAELSRLDKPAGTYYLFFPCAMSTFLAAPIAYPTITPFDAIYSTLLFLSGALIMRGAGCTINDLWDRNLDPHVERTRLRPIARGAIKPLPALIWCGVQCLAGLGILVQFPTACLAYGIPSLLFVATYPLAKRVTHYPQVVLGFTFSWGAIMGFPALGIDILASGNEAMLGAVGALYGSCIAWTVLYDMIYAHMDIKDDVKAGIKSIALRHEANTKTVLSGLACVQLGLLTTAGVLTGAGPLFYVASVGGGALSLGTMIYRVNLKSVKNCWWWFRNCAWFTGGGITAGLIADYLYRISSEKREQSNNITEKQIAAWREFSAYLGGRPA